MLLCSELRCPACVGDALGLESIHEGHLWHRERVSGNDSKWKRRSARARAARSGRHKRVRAARQQLLQLIGELLGRQGRLAKAKINCDTHNKRHKSG